ncbi:Alpha/Beta hydrolase protein [Amylocarpus encephaloides]|uniref:Alpha/Beta hydrolase protein n=1 Tax=Amylocarpus encephaloides TaxID=45428 RepID=A0A9P7YT46_9HELO|nr:Alpha/Beta hydrolase protein [Amylocarpus encephaloides]
MIHGGAFILGHSKMVNRDQIRDCQDRGWIVVVPEHRLCPRVDILEGPITDCRDALEWLHNDGLDVELRKLESNFVLDVDRIVAVGTSSGGTIALSLGFGVPKPVRAIFDLYGATNFSDNFWSRPHPSKAAPSCTTEFINQVYNEKPVPTKGGVSLEGQAGEAEPPSLDFRTAFAFTHISNGTLLDVCFPSKDFKKIDATMNIDRQFPPTFIAHGVEDDMVPPYLSKVLFDRLRGAGVRCEFQDIPGEGHTFAGKMIKGSRTWDLQSRGFDFLESIIRR